jgi:hypothetical protein
VILPSPVTVIERSVVLTSIDDICEGSVFGGVHCWCDSLASWGR